MNNPLFRTLAMCLMYPIFNYCQQLWCGAYLLFTGVGHCQLNLSQLYLDLVLHSFICRKGRCQKHPEGGGTARPLAVTMSPPHFFGHPTTLPPFFWSPIYPPPIFLVTHLPSPHFFGHPSTLPFLGLNIYTPCQPKKVFANYSIYTFLDIRKV